LFLPSELSGVTQTTIPTPAYRMTSQERRSSFSLAFIFALRMLGLFLVLPVFSLAASDYEGGDNAALVGLALGAYGLTQAVLQLPLGLASDRFGRKRVIVLGLLVFALGSGMAALADSVWMLVLGRAVQGAGAVSAAVTALLSDQTRDVVRTKAMALVGISIGLVFALALVLGPLLAGYVGLSGLFWLTALLALLGVAVVLWWVPAEPVRSRQAVPRGRLVDVLRTPDLLRLNVGVFLLHTVQMAMWSAVPGMLLLAGLAQDAHWQVYLPAVLLSVLFLGPLMAMERRGRLRLAMLLGIGLILVAQLALATTAGLTVADGWSAPVWLLGLWLVVFFCGFNALEALQPSQVSRMATQAVRGAALGAYSTLQSLGLFAGGLLGGLLMRHAGAVQLFAATALLAALWLALSWRMQPRLRDAA
jgi:MFS family permease